MKINYNEPLKFVGSEEVNVEFHHGGLRPAVGVNSIQVLRSNREKPEEAEGTGWTYNHGPMLAYNNGKLYLEYLSTPVGEHVPPGQTLLTTSVDGVNWEKPRIVFPKYKIPDGLFEYDGEKLPDGTYAVMHQRMGFFAAPNERFLIMGNYGICPRADQVPFGKFSIGRVVREIYSDDTFGPIYFIRYNKGTIWNESNTHYPLYKNSDDKGFVEACEALLANPLVTQQWAEEQGDEDELITVKSKDGGAFFNKAFCWYNLDDGTTIGLWKWMKCAVSHDEGKTWSEVTDTPTIQHTGAKIWGQRTSDGKYALVYNPHTNNSHRWPLAVAISKDGLVYDKLMCAAGEVSPKRYEGGPFKGFGLHYVRGIETDKAKGPDEAMYVTYSMNKEDIWISRIPVPVINKVNSDIHEDFDGQKENSWVEGWNTYSPRWAPVKVTSSPDGSGKCMKISDSDPYDYAKAVKVFKEASKAVIDIRIMAGQKDKGALYVELCDHQGKIPCRVVFEKDGALKVAHGRRFLKFMDYEQGRWYDIKFIIDTASNSFDVEVDGKSLGKGQSYQGQTTSMKGWFFMNPVKTVERLVLRTGSVRRYPNIDTHWTESRNLPNAGIKDDIIEYFVKSVDIVSKA